MCVLGAVFILIVSLSDILFESTPIADMLLHSPIFQISLLVILWFISPIFISITNIDENRDIRANTFVILGVGFLFIFLMLLATWLMA
jgi:hypothetical protein